LEGSQVDGREAVAVAVGNPGAAGQVEVREELEPGLLGDRVGEVVAAVDAGRSCVQAQVAEVEVQEFGIAADVSVPPEDGGRVEAGVADVHPARELAFLRWLRRVSLDNVVSDD